jgi:nucleoside-diphosphate-sugar epimerase
MRVLIAGCGYVGMSLGVRLVEAGHEVVGVRRSTTGAGELSALGIRPLAVDLSEAKQLDRLGGRFDWVVNTVASSHGGDVTDYERTYLRGTRNLLGWLEEHGCGRYVYTSSTGVYGQDDGAWVEESSVVEPEAATARVLLATEREVLGGGHGVGGIVLRLAGIYGPGRSYWLRMMERGEVRIPGDGTRWMNMVHRDDIVGAVMTVLERGVAGEAYNVCDNQPVQYGEFVRWLAGRMGMAVPPFAGEEGETRRKRGLTNKRVSNRKLREGLGWEPRYATYREGYAQLLA